MTETNPKPKRRRWRWLVVAMVAGFVAFWWLLQPPPSPLQFTTSDGIQISFLAANLTSLEYSGDSKAYQWVYQFLKDYGPTALLKNIPRPRAVSTRGVKSRTGAEPLLLLFELQWGAGPPNRKRLQEAVTLEFVDTSGHRFPAKPVGMTQTADGWEGWCIESFPRRDPKLMIQVTELSSTQTTVSFEIPNPGFRPDFPTWTPEELPQTKSDPQIDATLLKTNIESTLKVNSLPVEVVVNDPAWAKHWIMSWVEDATGNFGAGLSPFETAWKGRVMIARTDAASFLAEEKWSIGPFPLPAPGSKTSIEQTGRLGDTQFTVRNLESRRPVIRAASGPQPTPRAVAVVIDPAAKEGVNDLSFRVDMTGFPRNSTLIAIASDQAGRPLKEYTQFFSSIDPSSRAGSGVRFTSTPDTTHVSLTLIVSKPKEFEYDFAPPKN